MSQTFSLKYRPTSFGGLVGQSVLVKAIRNQYLSKREPTAWLFHGETGGGKTSLARILALSLQCDHQEEFGNPCKECRKRKTDFNIFEINASEVSGVEAVGDVVQTSNFAPLPPSKKRVYILDEAQRLSSAAQNLLLKYFEDAPKSTVWIICTTEPGKILRTLRRRCLQYPLTPLKMASIKTLVASIIEKEKLQIEIEGFLDAAFQSRLTSPGLILMALEKYVAGVSPETAVQGGETAIDTLRLNRAIVKGDLETVHQELKSATVEDARVIRSSVCQYLTTILLGTLSPGNNLSWGIEKLAEASRVEESVQLPYTIAMLHILCRKFGGGKAE